MHQNRLIRQRIWDRLTPVARPDARFHLDFEQFVPDFDGSDRATARVSELPEMTRGMCFVTPDNAMHTLRAVLIATRQRFVMASYNLKRGFLLIEPTKLHGAPSDLATLDAIERHATPIDLTELSELGQIGLIATGVSAVSMDGIRFGRGHAFLDMEWGIFSDLGLVDDGTLITAITHDVQLADDLLHLSDTDLPLDLIATPSRLLYVERQGRRPRGIRWDDISPQQIDDIPPLRELARLRGIA